MPAWINSQGIQQQGVVAAIDAGLHEDEVVNAELCSLGFDLHQRPMHGAVVPRLAGCCGIEDMHMAIPAAVDLIHVLINALIRDITHV